MKKKLKWTSLVFVVIIVGIGTVLYNFAARWDDVTQLSYSEGFPTSIQIPFKHFILIRNSEHIGAFRLIKRVSHNGFLNGVAYEFWYRKDGSMDLTREDTINGKGIVFERYRTIKKRDTESHVVDDGGKLHIEVGPFRIEWSDGNHIYAKTYLENDFSEDIINNFVIAGTSWETLDQINFDSKSLKWISSQNLMELFKNYKT